MGAANAEHDPEVVRHFARIRGDYGHEFSYGHFFTSPSLLPLFGLSTVAGWMSVLAQFKPTKQWLLNRIKQGDGASEAERAKGWC